MRVTVEDATGRKVVIDGDGFPAPSREDWDGRTVAGMLIKSEPERRFTLHCAYPAWSADRQRAADGFQDMASAGAVEEAAHAYMLKHQKIGAYHEDGTEGAGDLVESGIYRGPDWVIKAADGSECVIKAGDWLIGVIWHPGAVWDGFRSQRLRGVSMQGSAVRGKPSPESLANLRARRTSTAGRG